MKLRNNINLYDFLVLTDCDYDTYDTEYDNIITCVSIDGKPEDDYEKFYQEMCKKVEVYHVGEYELTVNWSDLIQRNLDKFKAFAKEHWRYAYEDDDDELIYQWIKEIHLYFAGYVSEDFYEVLCEFVETLN
jgi:hypothetical protein